MKSKNTGIFLMIASIYWILTELYYTTQRFVGDSAIFFEEHIGLNIIYTFQIIVPISLLILATYLIANKTESNKEDIVEPTEKNNLPNNMSVGDWLVNFLITIIPLVGLIFIIIWANDEKNRIRKNWAIASLIWMGIVFVLSIFLYATIFAAIVSKY